MKVGLVCPYSFDVPGGVQNHVRDLAVALRGNGHDVGVLAPGEQAQDLPDYVTLVGKAVPIPYNGSIARLAFGPRISARTGRWLREGQFDVLHVHEPLAPSVSLLALWASDGPVVGTFHTANIRSRAMTSLSALVRPALEKVTARIAVSESARATLVQHLGGEPVVIPNGLFCDTFATAEVEPRWQQPGPTVAFLGRIDEPRKGLPVLLEAWPEIRRQMPTCRLLVAGRGDPPSAAEDSPSGVEYLGMVTDDERGRLLRSATVYVAPQISGESFGIVLVEAMAAGTAVAASDLPAFRAVLADGETGRLFRAGDAGDLARHVIDLASHDEARLVLQGRAADAVRAYDWSRLVPTILAVYDTAVQVATRPAPR
ncbi:MAG: glycosyltransferase family 4 protein [Nocardioidaceae bacterium]